MILGYGLDDQPSAFLTHYGVFPRKLKFARNSYRLITTVLKKLDTPFRGCGNRPWHMPEHMPAGA